MYRCRYSAQCVRETEASAAERQNRNGSPAENVGNISDFGTEAEE